MLIGLRAAAWLAGAAWVGLLLARGKFWDASADRLAKPNASVPAPEVHAVIPARNEADVLDRTLASIVGQRYRGRFAATFVDDHSEDATSLTARAAIDAANAADSFEVVAARDRPAGWTGKVWALAEGVAAARARGHRPDFWWFTDADVAHDPQVLARLVATAVERRRDLVSEMVELHCEDPWERLLIPPFVFFFQLLYPFAWVNDARRATAAAAGGSVLLRDELLVRIGGLERIRAELIDDCALAAAVKAAGGRLWLGLSTRSRSVRSYDGLGGIWSMVARTAYTQLRYSPALVVATVAGMSWLYLVPAAATLIGIARGRRALAVAGLSGWLPMAHAYARTLRRYRQPDWLAFTLPLAAALYTAMTVDSALRHARRSGGTWKGRHFTPDHD